MTKCRSCGAEIKWIKTIAGKNMPVNPEAVSFDDVDESTVLVCEDGTVMASHGVLVDEDGKDWFVSHFATCPEADSWRKPSAAKQKIAAKAKNQGWPK